ncbi:hypothetical protein l11_14610 [Neisseria weaveri LMG 5135]|nr:hypothetical protein l11_14610 [Neisseria weaveri LMG 5135]
MLLWQINFVSAAARLYGSRKKGNQVSRRRGRRSGLPVSAGLRFAAVYQKKVCLRYGDFFRRPLTQIKDRGRLKKYDSR